MKIAVCIHAFYPELLPQILQLLHNLEVPFDLLITTVDSARELVDLVVDQYCGEEAQVRPAAPRQVATETVPNSGMDVLPFLFLVKKYHLDEYDLVLKLHTKNTATSLGRTLGKLAFDSVLGSCQLVEHIIDAFSSSPQLIMIGSHDLYRSAKYMMYNNRPIVRLILERLRLDQDRVDWGFFAGTMFWIRGNSLAPLAQAYEWLIDINNDISAGKERTGRDGSVAHALERIWGALLPSPLRQVGLVYRRRLSEDDFVVRIDADRTILSQLIRRVGVTDVLERWIHANEAVASLRQIGGVDEDFYHQQSAECKAYGIDPNLHYFLYGEIQGLDPSADFSTVFYRISRPDVFRHGVSSLVHSRNHGRREGIIGSPSWDHWMDLAERLKLFDERWYLKNASGVVESDLSCREHYRLLGTTLPISTSDNFIPTLMPNDDHSQGYLSVVDFLKIKYLGERHAYDEMTRVIENNDFELIPELANDIFAAYGVTAATCGALALACLKLGDWNSAERLLTYHWQASQDKNLPMRHIRSLAPRNRIANEFFQDVACNNASSAPKSMCIYTALFGDIDTLPSVLSISRHARFICFTDRLRDAIGWEYRICNPGLGDHNLNAKAFKVFPHVFLEEFDFTLFVDANTFLCGNLDEFLEKYLFGHDFVMFRHPERGDVYDEGVAIIEARRHSPAAILAQLRCYSDLGLPYQTGLVEASFIWRATHNLVLQNHMQEWWVQSNRCEDPTSRRINECWTIAILNKRWRIWVPKRVLMLDISTVPRALVMSIVVSS